MSEIPVPPPRHRFIFNVWVMGLGISLVPLTLVHFSIVWWRLPMRDDYERGYAAGNATAPLAWGLVMLGLSWIVYWVFGRARTAANALAVILLSIVVLATTLSVTLDLIRGPRMSARFAPSHP